MTLIEFSTKRLLLALIIGLAAASQARAKGGPLGLWPQPHEAIMRETLETPYAKALLKTLAANVRKDGDAACLHAKALTEAALITRARALLQTHGVRFLKIQDENFDDAAALSAFAALAGPNARAELDQLLEHPDVKKLEALNRPIPIAKLLETVFQQFDHYVLIGRLKLDPVSPVARGKTNSAATRANPEPAAGAAVMQFIEKNQSSKAIDRFLDLMEAHLAATNRGVKKEALAKLGPMQYFAGLDKDLAELCVGRR
jgi:hypothetical protein